MSGLARKSTHAKGGKKRRTATNIAPVKEPVGVVGEPSEVRISHPNIHGLIQIQSVVDVQKHLFMDSFLIRFVQQEYEIAQLGPIYVQWKKSQKRNEKGKLVWVSD